MHQSDATTTSAVQHNTLTVYNIVTQLAAPGTRLHSLMVMEVVECRVLQRQLTLDFDHIHAENVVDAPFHREFIVGQPGLSTLYLSADLSRVEVQTLAVDLLMKAIRVAAALIEQKHDAEGLHALRQKLTNVAKIASTADQLHTIMQTHELSVPEALPAWRMIMTPDLTEREPASKDVQQEEEAEVHTDYSAAVEGYRNLVQSRAEQQPPPVKSKAPTKTEADVKMEAYRREQAEKMRAIGEASAAAGLAGGVQGMSFPSVSPLSSTLLSAVAGLRVDNDDAYMQASRVGPRASSAVLGIYDGAPRLPTPMWLPTDGEPFVAVEPQPLQHPHTATDSSPVYGGAYTTAGPPRSSVFGTYSVVSGPNSAQLLQRQVGQTGNPVQSLLPAQAYQARLPHPPPTGNVDVIYCAQLDEDTQAVVVEPVDGVLSDETTGFADGDLSVLPTDPVVKRQNFVSGRVGEALAVKQLRAFLRMNPVFVNQSPEVTWLNEHAESGLPYDIEVRYADGTVKHCEVKTRSVSAHAGLPSQSQLLLPSQWFVSPAEIAQAHSEKQNYFCVLVSLQIDYITRKVHPLQTRILGYENGLTNAVYLDQATLYIQMNC